MQKIVLLCTALVVFGAQLAASAVRPVKPAHQERITLFSLSDVRVLNGPFKKIMDLDHKYLLSLDPDRLLSLYRKTAGLSPKAPPYPSWESEDVWGAGPLNGHTLGFYLSGLAMMYQATGDSALLNRIHYTLAQLNECQQANKDGYLLAYPGGQHIFKEVAEGRFVTAPASINNSWEPVYVMNKVMLGLYRVYIACADPLAGSMLVKMADYFGSEVLDHLSHDQVQKLLICEHGSISASFTDVYKMTGRKKYLEWAKKLNDEQMLLPLSKGKDILNGWHANTQISKFYGFEKVFDYTGEEQYTQAARYFWKTVVDRRSWVNGGNSVNEHFFPVDKFYPGILAGAGPESCNSIHMMQLTEALYADYAEPEKIAYYEKVLFNHILANYDPVTGMCVYYTTMRPGGYKVYGEPFKTFWCCSGTGLYAPAKFGRMIYAHDSSSLYVNLFLASEVRWKQKGVTLVQQTRFPDEAGTRLSVSADRPVRFTLKIRHPGWLAASVLSISINGKPLNIRSGPDTYARITRVWKDGDVVAVKLPAAIHVDTLPGSNRYVSVTYGPVALAAKVDNHGLVKKDFYSATNVAAPVKILPETIAPFLTGDIAPVADHIKQKKGSLLSFTMLAGNGKTIALIPFFRIHFTRYAVYFPHYADAAAYDSCISEKDRMERLQKVIANAMIDSVIIGNDESEKAHELKAADTHSGAGYNTHWRDAGDGGFFQYTMKTLHGKHEGLYVVFAGDDSGARIFDILVNGQLLQAIDHTYVREKHAGELYSLIIPVPEHLLNNQSHITVRFQAKKGNAAGGVFGLSVVNMDQLPADSALFRRFSE